MADNTLLNFVKETVKAYGDITDSYTQLVDLGADYVFRRMLIYNTLDKDVIIKFTNTETVEKTLRAGIDYGFDEFRHNGVIEIKSVGDVPTSGLIEFTSWRGE